MHPILTQMFVEQAAAERDRRSCGSRQRTEALRARRGRRRGGRRF